MLPLSSERYLNAARKSDLDRRSQSDLESIAFP